MFWGATGSLSWHLVLKKELIAKVEIAQNRSEQHRGSGLESIMLKYDEKLDIKSPDGQPIPMHKKAFQNYQLPKLFSGKICWFSGSTVDALKRCLFLCHCAAMLLCLLATNHLRDGPRPEVVPPLLPHALHCGPPLALGQPPHCHHADGHAAIQPKAHPENEKI